MRTNKLRGIVPIAWAWALISCGEMPGALAVKLIAPDDTVALSAAPQLSGRWVDIQVAGPMETAVRADVADGGARIDDLKPGRYAVRVILRDADLREIVTGEATAVVSAGEVTTLPIVLGSGGES